MRYLSWPSLAVTLALGLLASTAWAAPRVEVDVIDASEGMVLPTYTQRGERFIAGAPGHRYTLRLTNRTAERVLAVVSVDGVNVISGDTAHPSQTGYVLAPYGSTTIEGWRKSDREVAEFIFTSLSDSYAAQTGRPGEVGAIGVAVFEEVRRRPLPPPRPPQIAERQSAPAPASAPSKSRGGDQSTADTTANELGAQRQESLGTGHGDRRWAPVDQTTFERASRQPAEVAVVRYDSAENLRARGIRVPYERPSYHERRPNPFPDYVPDPPRRW